MENNIG